MAERFEQVEVVHGRLWLYLPGLALALAAPVLSSFDDRAAVAALVVGFVLLAANAKARKVLRGQLRVDAGHVSLGGVGFSRSRLAAARVESLDGTSVTLGTAFGWRWRVRLAGAEEAARLLHALGQSETQTDATFACQIGAYSAENGLGRRMVGQVAGFAIALLLLLVFHVPMVASLLAGLVASLVANALAPTGNVTVGRDGLTLRRGRKKSGRFLPYAEVERVSAEKNEVVVTLRGGQPPLFCSFDSPFDLSLLRPTGTAAMLLQRIEASRRLAAQGSVRIELAAPERVRLAVEEEALMQAETEASFGRKDAVRTAG